MEAQTPSSIFIYINGSDLFNKCSEGWILPGVVLCKMEVFVFLFLVYWHTNNTLSLETLLTYCISVQRIGRELSHISQSHLKSNISRTNELWNSRSVIIYNYRAKKCESFKYLKRISTTNPWNNLNPNQMWSIVTLSLSVAELWC